MKTKLVIKGVELQIPDHMTSLSQEIVDEMLEQDEGMRVVACGVFSSDKSLCFLTTTIEARIIRPNAAYYPRHAIPTIDGRGMEVIFEGVPGVHRIDSRIAYDNSESCLDLADLYVGDTYVSSFKLNEG